jgi:hypothetical protein
VGIYLRQALAVTSERILKLRAGIKAKARASLLPSSAGAENSGSNDTLDPLESASAEWGAGHEARPVVVQLEHLRIIMRRETCGVSCEEILALPVLN